MKKLLDYIQLLVSAATIVGVYFAYQGFQETMELQRETYAIQLYTAYFDLYESNTELVDTTITNNEKKWTQEYEAFAQRVLFTSESIYNVRGGTSAWDKTIAYMLSPHFKYYKVNGLIGDAYSEKFLRFYSKISHVTIVNM